MTSMKVVVIEAINLPNPELVGKADPFVKLEFQGVKKKTEVQKGELNPKWNEAFDFQLVGNGITSSDELILTVFDWERVGRNRQLGTARVSLADFTKGGDKDKDVALKDASGRPVEGCTVKLHITVQQPEGAAGGGGENSGGVTVDFGDAGDEDEDEDEDEVDGGGDATDGGGLAGKSKRKAKKKRRKGRKNRPQLSSRPVDQQIRVKVVQARQLNGSNLMPVCRVSIQNQLKQTRIKKSTTSPWWDESFFFNFHIPPSELVDEVVEFSVYNARTLRADALIGSFTCDVGLIYDEPQHALVNKWVLLSDPEDPAAGAKGYLKISACVLGPGDVSPNMASKVDDEDEDIESNLLRPAGVQLRPATFSLRIFCAEDIPRMDTAFFEGAKKLFGMGEANKELVDPYFVFGFAGKEVKSKIMYSNDHPDWYQELKLGLQFPSMCERLKLQIKDWDRLNQDDAISTAFLNISDCSSFGEDGFLPTYGPTYINLYGSTREYSDLPDDYDDLNHGKGEGVAYRGRALVELSTVLGELPESAVEDIPGDDKLRVQKFMRRRKFRIHAAFLTASMISSNYVDAPIEFEISMGNYGNKLDENTPPCPSTTQPTNAVFDGCYYYFLPWGSSKPCVVVDCTWEDIAFRLESLNILLSVVDRLEANIERVRIGVKAKLPMPELAQLLISLLDQLIADCDVKLSAPVDGKHVTNELDRLTMSTRDQVMAHVKEAAMELRESATDVNAALLEVENLSSMLRGIAVEPQNSMPDVIIWMISGQKRIAYFRIPANELLYSENKMARGKKCGHLITVAMKYPTCKDKDKKHDVPALLRIKLWLGLQTEEQSWHTMQTEGELAVYAESYENQVNILGSWTNRGPTMSRPKFSDSEGRISLKKESFNPPPGWDWQGDWYISPELSMLYDKDAGHKTYIDEVYECHSRNIPGGTWGGASRPWTDVKGDPTTERTATPLPEGWKWDDDWQIDVNRAVDEDGWEYCVEATVGGYGAVERTYHLCRRRRWLRPRTMVATPDSKKKMEESKKKQVEGWEYAPLFNMKFHAIERTMDLVRRRRWHRKMISTTKGAACFFNVGGDGSDDEQDKEAQKLATMAAPRMFLTHKAPHKYQLRAYVYQARDLLAADESGLSDPFARISFMTQSMVTERILKTLCPTWDQTLIFGEIEVYGNPKTLEVAPPEIFIELFDHDTFGKPEFLGRSMALPMVKLDPNDARTPVLQWYKIDRLGQDGGELLAAFELIKFPEPTKQKPQITGKDMPFMPPKRGELFIVPNGIRPVMQRTGIEVLCWGVRNMHKFQLASVTSPSVRFECGGHIADSHVIKDTRRNPNFPENLLFFDVMLPKEELYMPPMNIRVKDHRAFGRKPTVGVHILRSLEDFRVDPLAEDITEPNDFPSLSMGEGIEESPETNAVSEGSAMPQPSGAKGKGQPSEEKGLIHAQPVYTKYKSIQMAGPDSADSSIDLADNPSNLAHVPLASDQAVMADSEAPPPPTPETVIEMPPDESGKEGKTEKKKKIIVPTISPEDKERGKAAKKPEPFLKNLLTKLRERCKVKKKKNEKKEKLEVERRLSKLNLDHEVKESELTAQEIDWWSKYYASSQDVDKCKKYMAFGYDTFELLGQELEKSNMYNGFSDFCHTLPLTRGKQDDDEDDNVIGEFKGSFRVYPLPQDPSEPLPPRIFASVPPSDPEECVVRVYIIRAIDLQPGDPNGLADPYLEVELGKKKMNTRDDYIPNSINPIFGRLFEMKAHIPIAKDLKIRVKDYDLLSSDDVVGETVIDLENRYLSKYRATCGIPKTYWTSGINLWRDSKKPVELLKDYCTRNRIEGPIFSRPMNVRVGSKTFALTQFEPRKPTNPHLGPEDQRLALHVLNKLPLCKEHIESRPIFNPLQPNIEQGRLHMWVDIFPLSMGPPAPPFDVTPRKPAKFQLRCILWNTKDVILEEESITGEKMSDIYVQGWLGGIDEKQKTDVHYRSLDGEGNFNWRMVYPFEYQIAEEIMVVKKKEHFWSLDETEIRVNPKFIVQIWDNDKFSKDDFIGHLELNLNAMPLPAKRSRSCKVSQLPDTKGADNVKLVSLFDTKRLRGFWPCYDETSGERVLTGKVEMELELIPETEFLEKPVGLGQDEPNQHPTLQPPNRPETSFLWFASPFKTLKFILWRNYRCCILMTLLILLIILLVGLFIYSFPEQLVRLIMGT